MTNTDISLGPFQNICKTYFRLKISRNSFTLEIISELHKVDFMLKYRTEYERYNIYSLNNEPKYVFTM